MSTNSETEFLARVKQGDYRAIADHDVAPKGSLAAYLWIRAHLVLGNYEKVAAELKTNLADHPHAPFLIFQLAIYRREGLETLPQQALNFTGELGNSPLYQADYHFVLGYLFNLLSDYRQGIRHQIQALQRYRQIEFHGPAASSLFNLCVGFNYLNEPDQVAKYCVELEQLAVAAAYPSVVMHHLRFLSYQQAYREEYEAARLTLEKALEIAKLNHRLRDEGGLLCFLVYVLFRLGDPLKQEEWRNRVTQGNWEEVHLRTIAQFCDLLDLGLVTRAEVERKLRQWKQGIDSVNYAFLVQALLDRIARSQDYDLLARTAHRAGLTATRRQQSLALVDYRYHEILGLGRSGHHASAVKLLAAYAADAKEWNVLARLHRAKELARELHCTEVELPGEPILPLVSLNTRTGVLTVKRKRIDLSSFPLLGQLFSELMRSHHPIPLEQLFVALYGFPYHPFRNAGRLNSLIHRARKLVGLAPRLIRNTGTLHLDPNFRYSLVGAKPARENVRLRRDRIIHLLQRSKSPLNISDLEAHFPYSRRTLQLDLTHLTRGKNIFATQGTCTRRYSIGNQL